MSAAVAPFPRLPLMATVSVLAGVLVCASVARVTHFATPEAAPAALASTMLTFNDMPDGAVAVRLAGSGRTVETVPARDGGFLRSTMRVLATERERSGIGPAAPFTLTALPGGRMTLADTATGETLELEAFGPSNEAEFATILKQAEAMK
jgi:putative photosynthetic complex assembly protein